MKDDISGKLNKTLAWTNGTISTREQSEEGIADQQIFMIGHDLAVE